MIKSCFSSLSSYSLFDFPVLTFSLPPHLKNLRYIVIRQKHNILGANSIAPADSIPNVFFDSSVVPSFLVRKVENKSFPCTHKLGERTWQVWRDNSLRVRTHEKNCLTIGHNNTKHFLCTIRSRHPLEFLKIVR